MVIFLTSCLRVDPSNIETPPFPYKVQQEPSSFKDNPQALVLGDEMAKDFMRFAPILTEKWLKTKKIQFQFHYMGNEKDGLHRSFDRLLSIEKPPKFVFYFVGNHDLYEKKFHVKQSSNIKKNLKKYNEGKWTTLAYFVPFFKRYIYPSVKKVTLQDEIIKDETKYNSSQLIDLFSTNFQIYESELETFIRLTKKHKIHLVIVTNPINLNWPPQVICGRQTPDSHALMKKIEYYFATGEVKRAKSLLDNLFKEVPSNARVHYLLGKTNLQSGNYFRARENFISANSLDCNQERGNVVYNSIAKKLGSQHGVSVIDFFRMANDNLGKKEIFKDDRFPEDYLYQKLLDKIWHHIVPLVRF